MSRVLMHDSNQTTQLLFILAGQGGLDFPPHSTRPKNLLQTFGFFLCELLPRRPGNSQTRIEILNVEFKLGIWLFAVGEVSWAMWFGLDGKDKM